MLTAPSTPKSQFHTLADPGTTGTGTTGKTGLYTRVAVLGLLVLGLSACSSQTSASNWEKAAGSSAISKTASPSAAQPAKPASSPSANRRTKVRPPASQTLATKTAKTSPKPAGKSTKTSSNAAELGSPKLKASQGYSQIGSVTGMSRPIPGSTALPANSGQGRRVIYAKTAQRVWLVNDADQVQRTYLVSGRMDQPDPGVYRVFSKSRHATSAVQPPATMQYMIRFTKGKQGNNIGFHDLPKLRTGGYEQTEAQLGQPLSAGCVRQSVRDAAYLWQWAPVGTTVVVLG